MIRQTSIDVYHQIQAEGLLSRRRFETYECLFNNGPLTAMETGRRIDGVLDHSISPRFAELKRLGVIQEVGEKLCSITGRNVLLWDVTDRLPLKLEKRKKIKCKQCDGRGYHLEQQIKLF